MPNLSVKKFSYHLNVERRPTLTLYVALGIALVSLAGAAFFTYQKVYVPYTNSTVPEEKLTQKQDKLNLKDFETVRAALDAKQQGNPETVTINPFQPRLP